MKQLAKKVVIALCAISATFMALVATGCGEKNKCEHDYGKSATQVVKDSTCMEKGEELWTCGKCGEEKIVVTEKKAHNLDPDGIVKKEPTCTETGMMVFNCMTTDCTYSMTEKIDKTDHVKVVVPAVSATCTEAGATEYSYCQDCKTYIDPKTILSALGHQNKVLAERKATCTIDGLTQGTQCVICGKITKAQTSIPATGHTEIVDPYVAPTCGGGLTQGSHCGKCGEVLQAQTVIPGNNNHVNTATRPAINATCTNVGMSAATYCLACGETISGGVEIPKLAHNLVNGYCSVCNYHEHSIVTKKAVAATCTKAGKTVGRYCDICGEVFAEQITIPALGHDDTYQSKAAVSATCTTAGSTVELSCLRCDAVVQASTVIPATGHILENGDCTVCDYKHTHQYKGTERDLACTICGYEHTHNYTSVKYADANCWYGDRYSNTCTICNHNYTSEEGSAVGKHEFVNAGDGIMCWECGQSYGWLLNNGYIKQEDYPLDEIH